MSKKPEVSTTSSTTMQFANKMAEKSGLYKHLPLLKKATSSGSNHTPGYIFEELILISYESSSVSTLLAEYLASQLKNRSRSGAAKLKTLKAVDHVTRKGSRHFRVALRDQDEALREAANQSITQDLLTGSSVDKEIRSLAKDIRTFLFSDEIIEKDQSTTEEVPPTFAHNLSGLGSTSEQTGQGKYKGFGNSPISRETIGDKVRDIFEQAISIPDEKAEVINLCLTSSKGEYQSVQIPLKETTERRASSTAEVKKKVKTHIPGRAGGGWESSSSSDEEEQQLQFISTLSIKSSETRDNTSPLSEEISTHLESEEINKYCDNQNLPLSYKDAQICIKRLKEQNILTAVLLINEKLAVMDQPVTILRALLLIELLLRSEAIKPEVYVKTFMENLSKLSSNDEVPYNITVKSKKIILIINALKRHYSK